MEYRLSNARGGLLFVFWLWMTEKDVFFGDYGITARGCTPDLKD